MSLQHMKGELNNVKNIDIQIIKDIAFAKNLENNSGIFLTTITLLRINFIFKIFYCTLFLIQK